MYMNTGKVLENKYLHFGTSNCPWGEYISGLNKYSAAFFEDSILVTEVQ